MVSTRVVVLVSLAANLAIAAAKFVAYLLAGNVSMLSQTYYSLRASRSLIVGEGVTRRERAEMVDAIDAVEGVEELLDLRTMHLGPESVLVACDLRFRSNLDTAELERTVDAVEDAIRERVPDADRISVEAESADAASG